MTRALAMLAAILLALVTPGTAQAHKSSDSYLTLHADGARLIGQWDIALRDLDYAIGLDGNDDGIITWGEFRARQDAVAAYALAHLELHTAGQSCTLHMTDQLLDDHSDGAYAILRFDAVCPASLRQLTVDYDLLFAFDPQHRGLLRVEADGDTRTAVLGPAQRRWSMAAPETAIWRVFVDYLTLGVWHIWTGYDHILFLAALLLPAVLKSTGGRWVAVATLREAAKEVLKVVTAFTLAHSLTLSLAVLGLIAVPSRLVESAIAASVVAAAVNNLYPIVEKRLWLVAFGFGLVHGLGFANVLAELGLPSGALVAALFSFNLGVEIGQLAIVSAFLPAAYLIRRHWLYPRLVLGAGSLVIAVLASVWLAERSLDIRIIS
jgi:hypothetical protein